VRVAAYLDGTRTCHASICAARQALSPCTPVGVRQALSPCTPVGERSVTAVPATVLAMWGPAGARVEGTPLW
jgi:hypothetical protein